MTFFLYHIACNTGFLACHLVFLVSPGLHNCPCIEVDQKTFKPAVRRCEKFPNLAEPTLVESRSEKRPGLIVLGETQSAELPKPS